MAGLTMTAASQKRKKLPAAIETQILIESRRRCCLCFHLDADMSEKQGQIAHIDHQRTNNVESNLAFLCLVHHDRYDGGASQSKGITAAEVRHAKTALYQAFGNHGSADRVQLRVTVEADFDNLPAADKQALFEKIISLSQAKGEVRILNISRGSIRFSLEVDADDAALICKAFNNGALTTAGVVDVRFDPRESPVVTFGGDFERCSFGTSRPQVIDVVTHPDSTLSVPGIVEASDDPRSVSLFLKRYTEKYSVLVVLGGDREVMVALPLNHRFVDPPVGANPLEVLKEFLDKCGIALGAGGNGPKLHLSERITLPFNCDNVSDLANHWQRLASASGSKNHTIAFLGRPSLFDPRSVIVEMMFMICNDKYDNYLKELGRKIIGGSYIYVRGPKRKK